MQIIVTGTLLGGTYALIALGLTLQYGAARIMNLANGETLVAACFVAFWLFTALGVNPLLGMVLIAPIGPCTELADLCVAAAAARPSREEPRHARGRIRSWRPSGFCFCSRA